MCTFLYTFISNIMSSMNILNSQQVFWGYTKLYSTNMNTTAIFIQAYMLCIIAEYLHSYFSVKQ